MRNLIGLNYIGKKVYVNYDYFIERIRAFFKHALVQHIYSFSGNSVYKVLQT